MIYNHSSKECFPHRVVIGVAVAAMTFDEQISLILSWAKQRLSESVFIANVHMLIEAHNNKDFLEVMQNASLVSSDGMPLVWMLRLMGVKHQERVAGVDVLLALCEQAEIMNMSVFFLGSKSEILNPMIQNLIKQFPSLKIAGVEPLPYRPLTSHEDIAIIEKINSSNAGLLLVSLGCPKQEKWIHAHKGQINAVMIGLGGAFSVCAGIHKRAPKWLRNMGLEWLYRLIQEPRRLWKRYVTTIPIFIYLAFMQLVTYNYNVLSDKKQQEC